MVSSMRSVVAIVAPSLVLGERGQTESIVLVLLNDLVCCLSIDLCEHDIIKHIVLGRDVEVGWREGERGEGVRESLLTSQKTR